MPPTEAELLKARIAHMKALVDHLEQATAISADARKDFAALRQELDAARASLKIIDGSSS